MADVVAAVMHSREVKEIVLAKGKAKIVVRETNIFEGLSGVRMATQELEEECGYRLTVTVKSIKDPLVLIVKPATLFDKTYTSNVTAQSIVAHADSSAHLTKLISRSTVTITGVTQALMTTILHLYFEASLELIDYTNNSLELCIVKGATETDLTFVINYSDSYNIEG
eukprot:TRINITY_DN23215_c0_g1_i1.p1 TRINITY_DN23215_c0_g1~~TRINITY_DN23215_c0_g1_i1.p1  ORF type:complete len:168 (+),score=19.29 TRINITY_DN23215_c0_g1_i1:58-561(+)